MKGMRKDTLRLLEECYPHLGIDLIEERFKARSMPIGKIAKACHASIGRTVEGATASNRDALVSRLADLLVRHGMWQRSCDLMATLCSRKKRAPWIENVQDDFVRAGFPACIQELFESSGLDGASLSSGMALAAARRLHLLQDSAKSAYFAARVLDRPDAATCQRIEAALLVDECAEGKQRRTAQLVLEGDARSGVAAQDSGLYCAARARLLEEKDLEGALGALESCSGESLQQQPVLLKWPVRQGLQETSNRVGSGSATPRRCIAARTLWSLVQLLCARRKASRRCTKRCCTRPSALRL